MEFLWQLIVMEREYLGPNLHKGTFVCRCFKISDFVIGEEAIDQIHEFLRHYNLSISPYRIYDPEHVVRIALKEIRNYTLPNKK